MTVSRVAYTEQDDETVENENSLSIVWDVGGQDETPPPRRHHHQGANDLNYVVGISDRDKGRGYEGKTVEVPQMHYMNKIVDVQVKELNQA